MAEKNYRKRITEFEYIISSFIIAMVYIMSFPKYLQSVSIERLNIFWSREELVYIMFTIPTASIILAFMTRRYKTVFGVAVNVMLPIFVFISFIVAQYSFKLFEITYGIVSADIILCIIFWYKLRKSGAKRNAVTLRLMKYSIFAILLVFMVPAYFHYDSMGSIEEMEEYYNDMQNQMEAFDNIRGKSNVEYPVDLMQIRQWDKLDFEERYGLLYKIFALECSKNNMEVIPFKAKKLEKNDNVLGRYDNEENIIYIDQIHIAKDSAEDCVKTLLHEFRHYCQYETCNVIWEMREKGIDYSGSPYFKAADEWAEAVEKYEDIDGFLSYYENSLEADARDYSSTALGEYRNALGLNGDINEL